MNVHAIPAENESIPVENLIGGHLLRSGTALSTTPKAAAFEGVLGAAKSDGSALSAQAREPIHTVRTGDSLWRIVEERLKQSGGRPTGTAITEGVKRVARANRLKNPNLILVGQEIDVSALGTAAKSSGVAPRPVTRSAAAPSAQAQAPRETLPASRSLRVAQALPDIQTSLVRGSADPMSLQPLIDFNFKAVGGPTQATLVAKSAPVRARRADLSSLLQRILRPEAPAESTKASIESAQDPASPWSRLLSKPAHLTSGYGMRRDPFTGRPQFHDGVDLAAPSGTRIHPYASGTVVKSGWEAGYGKMVKVRHADGTESVYGHNLTNLVRVGDQVTKASTLGLVGSSGRSTGPHLHFEMRRNGRSVNPVPYLTRRYAR